MDIQEFEKVGEQARTNGHRVVPSLGSLAVDVKWEVPKVVLPDGKLDLILEEKIRAGQKQQHESYWNKGCNRGHSS